MLLPRLALLCCFTLPLFSCGGGSGSGNSDNDSDSSDIPVDQAFTHLKQQANAAVQAIAVTTDNSGDIYLGGHFTTYNSSASNFIIRLNNDGSIDTGFIVGSGFDNTVYTLSLATDGSGDIYVGGDFTSYNGSASNHIIRLNNDGSIDTTFDTNNGFDNTVYSLSQATDGTGDIYVGGDFTSYNGSTSNGIIRLNSDGSLDAGFVVGTGFDNSVRTLTTSSNSSGDIYVGGYFSSYNSSASNRIIRLNSNGSVDTDFNVGSGFDYSIHSLAQAIDDSGDIYVGGIFTSYNSSDSNHLIRLNNDGTIDPGFNVVSGFNSVVGGIVLTITPAIDNSGDIYIGGLFTNKGKGIIRLNSDGSTDAESAVVNDINGTAYTIALSNEGSGDVYVGGNFNVFNGNTSNHIIRLNNNNTVDTDFSIGGSKFNNTVTTTIPAVNGSGDIYVGGNFYSTNDTNSAKRIIRLNSNGSVDTGFSTGSSFNYNIHTLTQSGDGSGGVYVGGNFTHYNYISSNRIIRLNSDGSIDTRFAIGSGFNSGVNSITPSIDNSGDIYVAGDFTSYNGSVSNHIIRLNNNGTIDSGFNVGSGFDFNVYSLTLANDGSGDIFVGGDFTSYNGSVSNRIIRLNNDGSVDTIFATGTGFDNTVKNITLSSDGSGDAYVGGSFSSYNGSNSNNIIRLNSNGSIDAGFDIGNGFDNEVNTIISTSNNSGDIYVGGKFTSYNDSSSNRIIRLNNNGSVDTGFVVSTGFNSAVTTISLATDGFNDIYVGGEFTSYQTTTARYIIALNPDGSID